uniref:Uncharacterized protein n=1 Tax=Anguilla anguilla TaxID=7936 RepID=A0A0E9WB94_ANGAN
MRRFNISILVKYIFLLVFHNNVHVNAIITSYVLISDLADEPNKILIFGHTVPLVLPAKLALI